MYVIFIILHIQYASKKTSLKRTVQRGARSHSTPVHVPFKPRSAPIQAPFAIIGSPVRVLCGLPVFCTAEFLARAKLKSKAKKTTEKLGSTPKIFRGLRRTRALRALDSKLRLKRGRCRTCSIANSGPTSWHWYPSFQSLF